MESIEILAVVESVSNEKGIDEGIIFGALVLFFIDWKFGQGEDAALVNPTVDIPIILIAFVTLVILGTLIGLIPAHMATVVKPIEALREE